MRKVLFNVSNHPSSGWTDDQKSGWDIIVNIPFPNVDPDSSENDVFFLANLIRVDILNADVPEDAEKYISIQGDFSLCYVFLLNFFEEFVEKGYRLVVPTSRRIVTEMNGKKISKFEFKKWRLVEVK